MAARAVQHREDVLDRVVEALGLHAQKRERAADGRLMAGIKAREAERVEPGHCRCGRVHRETFHCPGRGNLVRPTRRFFCVYVARRRRVPKPSISPAEGGTGRG